MLSIILFTIAVSLLMSLVSRFLDLHLKLPFAQIPTIWTKLYLDRFALITTIILLGISTFIAIMGKWSADNRKLGQLEREKIQTELDTLRAQIHPHFLFNTLNTVYALSYLDVEASRRALAQASRLFRYQLYEMQQKDTTVVKELDFIRDYVHIMGLRLNKRTTIDFRLPDHVCDLHIAPMILICYIENAFKHGVDNEDNSHILIAIEQNEDTLSLMTKNKIFSVLYTSGNEESMGIGMQNTQRRLELLYPDRHQLLTNINTDTNEFELRLTIQLT